MSVISTETRKDKMHLISNHYNMNSPRACIFGALKAALTRGEFASASRGLQKLLHLLRGKQNDKKSGQIKNNPKVFYNQY